MLIISTFCLGNFQQRVVLINILHRIPDNFSMQGVNKEFQRVNSHCSHQIISKFLFNLSGHVADLVGFLTRDPSLIWNTAYSICVCRLMLMCLWKPALRYLSTIPRIFLYRVVPENIHINPEDAYWKFFLIFFFFTFGEGVNA